MSGDTLSVHMLGTFTVRRGVEHVAERAWRLRKARAVIKLLALAPNHMLHREQVTEALWPRLAPSAARNNLNQVLHAARRALDTCGLEGSSRLVLRGDMLHLSPDKPLWVDVDAFEQAAARARRLGTEESCRHALSLYAGALLPEDRYEPWTGSRRGALQEQALSLLAALAALHRDRGDGGREIEVLHEALSLDPLHEPAHRDLMRAFSRAGRRQEALAQFERLRDALADALAAEPEPRTRALYKELLVSAGDAAAPLAKHPGSAKPLHGNLSAPLTSFVGRQRQLAELATLLEHERLVTLTGAGGSGKTRLAMEAAAGKANGLPGGAWIVRLEALSDGRLVAQAVARALSVRLPPEAEALQMLIRELAARGPLLLVLDNCEHLIDDCAAVALELLQACPGITLFTTSREPLRVPGEVVFDVPPLALPEGQTRSTSDISGSEAVQLFVERATARAPGFALDDQEARAVAQICLALDGIPLAIELAAAAVGALAPRQIADRLATSLESPAALRRDRAPRHQTMRAALDWSHDLLQPEEQVLFRRLGVFAGSFSLEAAEGVCAGDPIEAAEVLNGLIALVEKSLVQSHAEGDERRYRLLQPVGRYAAEKLADAAERRELQRRHRDWYRALISELDPESAAGRPGALDRLELEHDNIRAALASGLVEEPEAALAIAAVCWPFWLERGHFDEGARWLHSGLSASRGPSPARGQALLGACALDTRRGAFDRRTELAAERLRILRGLGDPRGVADAVNEVGLTAWSQSDHRRAEQAFAEATQIAQEIGDDRLAACVGHSRALLEGSRGDFGTASRLLTEARGRLERIGPDERRFFPAATYCLIVADEPWCPGPRLYFEDSMMLFRRLGVRAAEAYVAAAHAHVVRAGGSLDEALELAAHALSLADELGDPAERAVMLVQAGNLARAREEHARGRRLLEEAGEIRRALGDRRGLAMAVGDLGLLEAAAGDGARGRALLGEALDLFTETRDVVPAAGTRLNLANVALAEGNVGEARTLLHQSLEPVARRGLGRMSSWMRAALAETELALGATAPGRRLLEDARREFDALGDRRGLARCARVEPAKPLQTKR